MFIGKLLGLILRFIFVYRFNWKKMDRAYRDNEQKEKDKDVLAGAIGFVGIAVYLIIYLWLFD